MTRWKDEQKKIIGAAIEGEQQVVVQDIAVGNLFGTTYVAASAKPTKGILVVAGFSGNRHAFGPLCNRLARAGYFCLCIDLPGHYRNPQTLELGRASELVMQGTEYLASIGMKRIAVIGHSMGATAALFATASYTTAIEHGFYAVFDNLASIVRKEAELTQAGRPQEMIVANHAAFEAEYKTLKDLMIASIRRTAVAPLVSCYVFLAPPADCKAAVPGVSLLRYFSDKWVRKIVYYAFHKPATAQAKKEGFEWSRPADPNALDMQFFRAPNVREFMEYFLSMKEPKDFLKLLDELEEFKNKDAAINLFGYYKRKILSIPKLFIYGTWDFQLQTLWNPFASRRLERFYAGCGNAKVIRTSMSHMMLEGSRSPAGFITMTDKKATFEVIRFLQENLGIAHAGD